MKSCAGRLGFFLFAVLFVLAAGSLNSETRCKCRHPPGGSHGCEDQQVAYCKIQKGECIGWCGSKKTSKKHGKELVVAILSEGLGKRVTERDLKKDPEYRLVYEDFLESKNLNGSYELTKDSRVIFVQVPGPTQEKLAALPPKLPEKRHFWFRDRGTPIQQIDDSEIDSLITAKLSADREINPFNIDVDTNSGEVVLRGSVAKDIERSKAEQIALDTPGVKRVINLIKVDVDG